MPGTRGTRHNHGRKVCRLEAKGGLGSGRTTLLELVTELLRARGLTVSDHDDSHTISIGGDFKPEQEKFTVPTEAHPGATAVAYEFGTKETNWHGYEIVFQHRDTGEILGPSVSFGIPTRAIKNPHYDKSLGVWTAPTTGVHPGANSVGRHNPYTRMALDKESAAEGCDRDAQVAIHRFDYALAKELAKIAANFRSEARACRELSGQNNPLWGDAAKLYADAKALFERADAIAGRCELGSPIARAAEHMEVVMQELDEAQACIKGHDDWMAENTPRERLPGDEAPAR